MPVENTKFIAGLNADAPTGVDPKSQGDDHLRLLKEVLQQCFAGFPGEVAIVATETQGATVNDYLLTTVPALDAYAANTVVFFRATHANTGAATVRMGALSVKPLLTPQGTALRKNAVLSNTLCMAVYDGTSFRLMAGNSQAIYDYVDSEVLGSAARNLRVPGAETISALPAAADRAGKLLSFDAAGAPMLKLPATGSVEELYTQLAKPDGAKVIGFNNTNVDDVLRTRQQRNIHKGFAYDYLTRTRVVRDGSIDNMHRHFGQIVEGVDGRLHLFYGKNPVHGLTSGATTYHCYSDDGARTFSEETIAIPPEEGYDCRNMSAAALPNGDVVLIYAAARAPSAAPTVFRQRRTIDNGKTFVQDPDIMSVPFAYARTYGRIKLIPGVPGTAYRMAFTPYHQSSSAPTYKVPVYVSDIDGKNWQELTPIFDNATGYTETEIVAINGLTWIAVSRSGAGLMLSRTIDGGVSWATLGTVPLTTSDSQVAPTLDKFKWNGRWYILLAYCNRQSTTDQMVFRIACVDDVLNTANAFSGLLITSTDMQNASGYQCPIAAPDGCIYLEAGTGFIEFKEYDGLPYSQVRFVSADLIGLARIAGRVETVAAGATTANVFSSDFETQVILSTAGASVLENVYTFTGGHEGQIVVIRSPTGTRDVVLHNGMGNLVLDGNFRLNEATTSRIVLMKVGTYWVELGRTFDNAANVPALVISNDAIVMPPARSTNIYLIDTEAGAAFDDLSSISGGTEGQMVVLSIASGNRRVTVKDAVANIQLSADFVINSVYDTLTLIRRGTFWLEVSRADNAPAP